MALQSKSKKIILLQLISMIGRTRKTDLLLCFTKLYSDKSNGMKYYKELLKLGLITELVFDSDKAPSGQEVIVSITQEGLDFLAKRSEGFNRVLGEGLLRKERTSPQLSNEKLKRLQANGIKCMFFASGIPVAVPIKPSLDFLYSTIALGRPVKKKGYLESRRDLSFEDAKRYLANGVFYTIREFREFLASSTMNTSNNDTFSGSRARGIFISDTDCFIVYAARKYNNKLLKVLKPSEAALCDALDSKLPQFTNVMRKKAGKKWTYEAIIFSDTDKLMYMTVMGSAGGKLHGKKTAHDFMVGETGESGLNNYIVTGADRLFNKIHIIPTSSAGSDMLSYLLSHPLESIEADGRGLISSTKGFKEDHGNALYPYRYKGTGSYPIYLPVFTANTLDLIIKKHRAEDGPEVIFTRQDLANAVSHSLRDIPFILFDLDGNLIDEDSYYLYSHNGDILGRHILKETLARKGLMIDGKTGSNVMETMPSLCNLTGKAFYNALAKGKIDIERLIPDLPLVPLRQKARKERCSITVCLNLTPELNTFARNRAEELGLNLSQYLRGLVREEQKKTSGA